MLAVATLDIAKMRAEAEAAVTPEVWQERAKRDFETALILIGIMREGESLDDLPDTIDY